MNKAITSTKVRKKVKWYIRAIPVYLMMFPAFLYIFINNYLPMYGILIAFKKINWKKGIWKSPWAGLNNFKYLFKTQDAFIMMRNTLLYNVVFIILGLVVALTIAILLNEVRSSNAKKFYQTCILLPQLFSMVLIGFIVFAFLSTNAGYINNRLIRPLGNESINWYQEPKYWPFILTFVHLWKGVGYSSVIYLSSIVGISDEYYEAARLDGATKWQQITKITLPLIRPTIIILLILSISHIFNSDFGLFYQVPRNSGALYNVTTTIDTYVYNALMRLGNVAMSSAASTFQAVVGFVLVIVTNTVVRRISKEDALF